MLILIVYVISCSKQIKTGMIKNIAKLAQLLKVTDHAEVHRG